MRIRAVAFDHPDDDSSLEYTEVKTFEGLDSFIQRTEGKGANLWSIRKVAEALE